MSELLALAERCEKATGPDRELDGLIYRSIDPVIENCWKFWSPAQLETIVPRYTASLDAGLMLMPKGYASAVGTMAFAGTDRKPWATYWTPQGEPHTLEAATPALALTASCLRARSSLPGGAD